MADRIIAACDGASKGNPGPAAWAWVVTDGRKLRWTAGPLGDTTNNVAELTALERLLSATDPGVPLEVRMDSQYAMKAVTTWLPGWKKNGWMTSAKKPVANRDLVVRIDALLSGRDVRFVYVPAHQVGGDRLNAVADHAASQAAVGQRAASGSYDADGLPTAVTAAPARPAVPAQAKKKASAPVIAAKFAGTCGCGKPYKAGEKIAKGPHGWGHPACATAAEGR
jgi:ribonuclease HI